MKDTVMTSVTQPPSLNLMATVTTRIERDIRRPRRLMVSFLPRWGARVFNQWRDMARAGAAALVPGPRGRSRAPVGAPTNRQAPSDTGIIPRTQPPRGTPPIFQV